MMAWPFNYQYYSRIMAHGQRPAAGVPIYAHDRDGNWTQVAVTDEDGRFEIDTDGGQHGRHADEDQGAPPLD